MAISNVLRLDEYRDRRDQRLKLAAALHFADRGRYAISEHLAELATLLSAGRAATVWVDEYGPGLVHPHVVLDLASDRPRRSFAIEPLRRAWESGVPGVYHSDEGRGKGLGVEAGGTIAVALGSDGTRAWFLVADSVTAHLPLTEELQGRVMFLAGECSGVVLHRDLDDREGPSQTTKAGFAGWPILRDIEGREDDERESRRISLRFIVARLPRLLADDDLMSSPDRLREKADRAREEIERTLGDIAADFGEEQRLWEGVLGAFEQGSLEALGSALLELGEAVEGLGHHHGAAELYGTAYEISAAIGHAEVAVEAARFSGRVLRRMARWAEAQRWYDIARRVAEVAGLDAKTTLVLVGVANIQRERGNLPAVRATLTEALPYAKRSGDPQALGQVHHARMALEHMAGALDTALESGWDAVRAYERSEDRVRALADLAGVLTDLKELDAAEDAWNVVLALDRKSYYRLYALDALGHVAALRGDADEFRRRAAEADAMGWEAGAMSAKVEILHYRGLSYAALGLEDEARAWLSRAIDFAKEHAFNRTLFAAEAALESLDRTSESQAMAEQQAPPPAKRRDVREGLHAWRLELAGTPG